MLVPVMDQVLLAFVPISVSLVPVPIKLWMLTQAPTMVVSGLVCRLTVLVAKLTVTGLL